MTSKLQRTKSSPKKDKVLAAAREEEILRAATRVFAEHGYRGTDVQEIADIVGIGKITVYRYFPSKQELFLAVVDRGMKLLHKEIAATYDDKALTEPFDRMRAGMAAYLRFFDQNMEFVELFIQERSEFRDRKTPTFFEFSEQIAAPWTEMLKLLIVRGKIKSIDIENIRDFIGQHLYGVLFTHYFTRSSGSLESALPNLIDIIFNGILSDSERLAQRRIAAVYFPLKTPLVPAASTADAAGANSHHTSFGDENV